MKASFFRKTGEPDVLEFEDFEDPVTKDGEILVKVKACALNRLDIWLRSGRYKVELPHILGSDISGIRLDTNEEVVVNPQGKKITGLFLILLKIGVLVSGDLTLPWCPKYVCTIYSAPPLNHCHIIYVLL